MHKRIIHDCDPGTGDMFYCSGVGGKNDPELTEGIDWFAHEDPENAGCAGQHQTVSCIEYCPWCGKKLPSSLSEVEGDTFTFEEHEYKD